MRTQSGIAVDDRGDNVPTQLLSTAKHEIGHLAETCDSLLSWAADENSLKFDPVDVAEIVPLKPSADANTNATRRSLLHSPEQRISDPGSPNHIRVAISNLLRNALYYSPRPIGRSWPR